MHARHYRPAAGLRLAAVSLTLLASVVAMLVAGPAHAADLSKFRPGNIISDSVFFNSSTMSADQIQSFLNGKVPRCEPGYTCLKDFRQSTRSISPSTYCNGYSGDGNDSAASIIYKVAVSCGINPQVLLVILQKEQGLVTHVWPSDWRYTIAMGQGCPDTAGCDTQYYGFQNQVYGAARQFKIYAEGRYFTYYAPGNTWNILYNPNSGCGSSPIYIENKATAGLYYYTPYQPNAAALRAGYGEGDGCSAYGNRNFYQYFTDWFGSTGFSVTGSIGDYWRSSGAANGPVGDAIAEMATYSDGWGQQFVSQDLYIRSGANVVPVQGSIRACYRVSGAPAGVLRWPMERETSIAGGWYQQFERGRIYASINGLAYVVRDAIGAYYAMKGGPASTLGWPQSDTEAISDGLMQSFTGGSVFSIGDRSFELPAPIASVYTSLGGPAGGMGWPTSGLVPDATGAHVTFDRGWYQQGSRGTYWVIGDIGSLYVQLGARASWLGEPIEQQRTSASGWSQKFENGTVYSSASGTYAVSAAMALELEKIGGPTGDLGYPVSEAIGRDGVSTQEFSGGYLTASGGSIYRVQGAIGALYRQLGGSASSIGYPTSNEIQEAAGWYQSFTGGAIAVSQAGTYALSSAARDNYEALSRARGRLGWPVAAQTVSAGVTLQRFQGGILSGEGAIPVWGSIRAAYDSEILSLGAAATREASVPGGWSQTFERGSIYAQTGQVAHPVLGAVAEEYARMGAASSRLGWPTANATAVPGGSFQDFAGGTFTQNGAGHSARFVTGQIDRDWRSLNGTSGRMGFPVNNESFDGRGWRQDFQGGTLFVRGSDGRSLRVVGALAVGYAQQGGVDGALGWPTGNEFEQNGLWSQQFQGGLLQLDVGGSYSVR